jgi:hypothetical protein
MEYSQHGWQFLKNLRECWLDVGHAAPRTSPPRRFGRAHSGFSLAFCLSKGRPMPEFVDAFTYFQKQEWKIVTENLSKSLGGLPGYAKRSS